MMKSILSLMLAALLAMSLAGCGVVADLAASASPKNRESSPVSTSASAVVRQETEPEQSIPDAQ